MDINAVYVREQQRYTESELQAKFKLDDVKFENTIKNLKAVGVLKIVKNTSEQISLSDLVDEDIEIVDETVGEDKYLYVFRYVGVITVANILLKVFPKYIVNNDEPLEEMKQILQVLEKYDKSNVQSLNLYNAESDNKRFNVLPLILFLMNDYFENGEYGNLEEVLEINGDDEIQFERTIEDFFPMIVDDRPYYTEFVTKRKKDDEQDFVKRIHKAVITECSKELHASEMDALFNMETVYLTDEKLEDLGDTEYLLDYLFAELSLQYNSRKQLLIKSLYAYIKKDENLFEGDEAISMYGTTAFYKVWEQACKAAFDDKLSLQLGDSKMNLPVPLDSSYNADSKLKNVIDCPIWTGNGTSSVAKDTLEPDVITFYKKGVEDYFIIFDAKYYLLELSAGNVVKGNPGVEDVNKQYLYLLAYQNFISKHHFTKTINCFLLPTQETKVIDYGSVKMPIMSSLKLDDVLVRKLPAKDIFECYLSGEPFDISSVI